MIVYHRTAAAEAILSAGFRDSTGTFLTADTLSGVWLSDVPLTVNEGAKGDTTLSMEIPDEVLTPFECVESGKSYREFLMPAETVNQFGLPTVFDDDWKGCTRGMIQLAIEVMRQTNKSDRADALAARLPFLEKYGLLAESE